MKQILGYGPTLRSGLQSFIRSKQDSSGIYEPWGRDFLERLERFATTGKLLRGSVLCLSYERLSGQVPDEAVTNAAMALELTHSALLIHDDVMDGDNRRRGKPSMHSQYQLAAQEKQLPAAGRFGINMALCAGDAAIFLAFELLSKSQAAHPGNASFGLFVDQLLSTCMGQMQDIYLEARPEMPSKKEIDDLMRTKTAAYTLALPLAMGGALASQPPSTLRQLQRIGITAGTIFQIRDDELGVTGNPKQTGKPVGADIKEGKKTLVHYYLLKRCAPTERTRLKMIFGNPHTSAADIAYVQKLMPKRGVPAQLDKEVKRLEVRAAADIDKLSVPGRFKSELKSLVRFCSSRSS